MFKNLKKRYKALIIFGSIVTFLTFFLGFINIIPPKKVIENNPFIKASKEDIPMLAAHRGGALVNPENTLKAYKAAVEDFDIDIIESDIWVTKDGKLVFSHDGTIDRMSDVSLFDNSTDKHYIKDYTLEELENFNFGYGFKDKNGNYPYKNLVTKNQVDRKTILKENGVQILQVDKLLEEFYESKPDLKFIVEIKNDGEEGQLAAGTLDNLLTNIYPNYKNNLVVGTFHDEVSQCLRSKHPTLHRGASTGDAAKFIITEWLKVNPFDDSDFTCLQIPTSFKAGGISFSLDDKQIINRAHRKNMAVQYRTIDDAEEMKYLADLGCDCIMTNDPELFIKTFKGGN